MANLDLFLKNGTAKIIQIGKGRDLKFLSRNIGDVVEVTDIDEKSKMVRVEVQNITYKKINNTVPNTLKIWLDETMLVIADEPIKCVHDEWKNKMRSAS